MTYEEARAYIASLAPRGWRLGLDRMREFARRAELEGALGERPGPRFIHIAGTNGKGSATAYVQSILHEAGFRVGAYYSPYVYEFRERVQIGREYIPESRLAELTARLKPIAETFDGTDYEGITEFEFKTALGLLYWMEENCDWVSLEVGLGGRLDATNIVLPKSCAIVSIGLDHTAILGPTVAEIAREKAGIIKPGVPCAVGNLPSEALEAVREIARAQHSPLWEFGRGAYAVRGERTPRGVLLETPARAILAKKTGIQGVWQPHNAAVALAAVDASGAKVSDEAAVRGIENASLPGRFEVLHLNGRTAVLDGGHNADAAESLAETLQAEYPGVPVVLVCGMNKGHEPLDFLRPLRDVVEEVFTAPLDFHRTYGAEELANEFRVLIPNSESYTTVAEAVKAALASPPDRLILVAGSFYLLAEAKEALLHSR